MKYYLVGGAVRDKLLNYPVIERDWVVVGATTDQMLAKGFKQVGKDFPVFLHPDSQEEYALARTERKQGSGYTGFSVHAVSDVSLEQDLLRRDLTINAMALDEKNELTDPFSGKKDLADKLLRHVSNAFCEDPVRILRVARFSARYYHLGFQVAKETRRLMHVMVASGEVNHLVAERVWKEFERSLSERNPEQFIMALRQCGALKVILPEIDDLFGVPNPPKHHPEIDSGVHSLMVLRCACSLSDSPVVRFAALVHDLGKALTPFDKLPSHNGHDESGVAVIQQLCRRLRVPKVYESLAVKASRFHILIHKFDELKASTRVKLLERCDAFRKPDEFEQLLLVCESDAKGRLHCDDKVYSQAKKWRYLLEQINTIEVKSIIEQGYKGAEIQLQLHQKRVAMAKQVSRNET